MPLATTGLTAKQETFCQAIAAGKSQSDAYKEAYNCQGWKPGAIYTQASILANDRQIVERIKALTEATKDLWPVESRIKVLKEIGEDKTVKPGARISAVDVKNKMDRLYADQQPAPGSITYQLVIVGEGDKGLLGRLLDRAETKEIRELAPPDPAIEGEVANGTEGKSA